MVWKMAAMETKSASVDLQIQDVDFDLLLVEPGRDDRQDLDAVVDSPASGSVCSGWPSLLGNETMISFSCIMNSVFFSTLMKTWLMPVTFSSSIRKGMMARA